MKGTSWLIIAALGIGAVYALSKSNSSSTTTPSIPSGGGFDTIAAGTVTPAGNPITQAIHNTQEGLDYINKTVFQKPAMPAGNVFANNAAINAVLATQDNRGLTEVAARNRAAARVGSASLNAVKATLPRPSGNSVYNHYY